MRRTRRTRRTKRMTTTTAKMRMRKRRPHLDTAQILINYEKVCFLINLKPVKYVGIMVKGVR
jgi:hypothetical protein